MNSDLFQNYNRVETETLDDGLHLLEGLERQLAVGHVERLEGERAGEELLERRRDLLRLLGDERVARHVEVD